MDDEIRCDGCARDNVNKPATFYCCECDDNLCGDCKRFHSRIRSTMNHRLVNIEDKKDGVICFKSIRHLDKCSKHTDMNIKFHCQSHDEYCCEKCAIAHHRKCDHLVDIEELLMNPGLKETSEMLQTRLKDNLISCDKLSNFHQYQKQKLDDSRADLGALVQQLKDDVNRLFLSFERRLSKEFENIKAKKVSDISKNLGIVYNLKAGVSYQKATLDYAQNFGNKSQQFFANMKIEKDIEETETTLDQLYGALQPECPQLTAPTELTAIIQEYLETIKVQMKQFACKRPEYSPIHKKRVILEKQMKMADTSTIDGCAVLPSGDIVISSRTTNNIHILNLTRSRIMASRTFSSAPGHLQMLFDTTIGVVFSSDQKIGIMKIEKTITPVKEIQVRGECYGLAYYPEISTLYTASRSSGDIESYGLDGTRRKEIRLTPSVRLKVKEVNCMTYDSNQNVIILSCHSVILFVNLQGQVVFDCNFRQPWGVILDHNSMYLCLYEDNVVRQMSTSGEMVRDILTGKDGIKEPKAIAWNNNFKSFVLVAQESVRRYRFEYQY